MPWHWRTITLVAGVILLPSLTSPAAADGDATKGA